MPSTSIVCGALLIVIGILGYINSVLTGHTSGTALIPAGIGIVLLLLGIFARRKDNLRKHLMHAAVVIALLGFIGVLVEMLRKFDSVAYSPATVAKVSTALVCLLFVILAVKSFVDARRRTEPA